MTPIAGQESRYRNLPSTLAHDEGNIASERTSDRLRREAADEEVHKASHPPEHPWVTEARAQQAAKDAERQAKIASGKLVIHANGYTEKL
jgi:hypothetical protein